MLGIILGPPSNQVSCTPMAFDADIYFVSGTGVRFLGFDFEEGASGTVYHQIGGASLFHVAVDPDSGAVFVSGAVSGTSYIYKVTGPAGSASAVEWRDDISNVRSLAARGGYLYWTRSALNAHISRAPINDANDQEDLILLDEPKFFDVGDTYIVTVDSPGSNYNVQRYDLDGTNVTSIKAAGSTLIFGVGLDEANGYVYWGEVASGFPNNSSVDVYRRKLDASESAELFATTQVGNQIAAIKIANDLVYVFCRDTSAARTLEVYDLEGNLLKSSESVVNGGGDIYIK